jgi:hypothetical protein
MLIITTRFFDISWLKARLYKDFKGYLTISRAMAGLEKRAEWLGYFS